MALKRFQALACGNIPESDCAGYSDGSDYDYLDGGAGFDILLGRGGSDLLAGGPGNDILTGGTGTDVFFFNSPTEGIDTITDFSVVDDTISIYTAGFVGGTAGTITPNQFVMGATASDANHRFIYDTASGALFFDVDGIDGTGQVQFATLSTGLAMTNANIVASL